MPFFKSKTEKPSPQAKQQSSAAAEGGDVGDDAPQPGQSGVQGQLLASRVNDLCMSLRRAGVAADSIPEILRCNGQDMRVCPVVDRKTEQLLLELRGRNAPSDLYDSLMLLGQRILGASPSDRPTLERERLSLVLAYSAGMDLDWTHEQLALPSHKVTRPPHQTHLPSTLQVIRRKREDLIEERAKRFDVMVKYNSAVAQNTHLQHQVDHLAGELSDKKGEVEDFKAQLGRTAQALQGAEAAKEAQTLQLERLAMTQEDVREGIIVLKEEAKNALEKAQDKRGSDDDEQPVSFNLPLLDPFLAPQKAAEKPTDHPEANTDPAIEPPLHPHKAEETYPDPRIQAPTANTEDHSLHKNSSKTADPSSLIPQIPEAPGSNGGGFPPTAEAPGEALVTRRRHIPLDSSINSSMPADSETDMLKVFKPRKMTLEEAANPEERAIHPQKSSLRSHRSSSASRQHQNLDLDEAKSHTDLDPESHRSYPAPSPGGGIPPVQQMAKAKALSPRKSLPSGRKRVDNHTVNETIPGLSSARYKSGMRQEIDQLIMSAELRDSASLSPDLKSKRNRLAKAIVDGELSNEWTLFGALGSRLLSPDSDWRLREWTLTLFAKNFRDTSPGPVGQAVGMDGEGAKGVPSRGVGSMLFYPGGVSRADVGHCREAFLEICSLVKLGLAEKMVQVVIASCSLIGECVGWAVDRQALTSRQTIKLLYDCGIVGEVVAKFSSSNIRVRSAALQCLQQLVVSLGCEGVVAGLLATSHQEPELVMKQIAEDCKGAVGARALLGRLEVARMCVEVGGADLSVAGDLMPLVAAGLGHGSLEVRKEALDFVTLCQAIFGPHFESEVLAPWRTPDLVPLNVLVTLDRELLALARRQEDRAMGIVDDDGDAADHPREHRKDIQQLLAAADAELAGAEAQALHRRARSGLDRARPPRSGTANPAPRRLGAPKQRSNTANPRSRSPPKRLPQSAGTVMADGRRPLPPSPPQNESTVVRSTYFPKRVSTAGASRPPRSVMSYHDYVSLSRQGSASKAPNDSKPPTRRSSLLGGGHPRRSQSSIAEPSIPVNRTAPPGH